MERGGRLRRPDLVRPRGVLRRRRLHLDHPACQLRLESVARLAGRDGDGWRSRRRHRHPVLPRRPARLLLRADHAGLRRGLPHRRQLRELHARRARHADQGRFAAGELPVHDADRALLPRAAALHRLAADRLVADAQPVRCAAGRDPRERGRRPRARHRRLRREGEGAHPVRRDVRRRRDLLCPEVSLHRSHHRLRHRQVGRDAAGHHGRRRRHDLRPADRLRGADRHQRADALGRRRGAGAEERPAAQPDRLWLHADPDRGPPARRLRQPAPTPRPQARPGRHA